MQLKHPKEALKGKCEIQICAARNGADKDYEKLDVTFIDRTENKEVKVKGNKWVTYKIENNEGKKLECEMEFTQPGVHYIQAVVRDKEGKIIASSIVEEVKVHE